MLASKLLKEKENITEELQNKKPKKRGIDVAVGSDLSGYIYSIMAHGLLYGTDDGYYHAEQGVTYGDACITMVRLLGYSKSDLTGSYPINYMKKAADLKLTYQYSNKNQ